ncbi:MAG: sodium:calcium antiporter [Bacteroidia bacterium]|nr:sodium:calcium antiporter [Bacteroidia bacterium]
MINHWLGFTVCLVVVLLAGSRLPYYGDMLAEKTGLSRAFIGLFLMSVVTSIPEVMVGFSAAVIVKSANLAVGDILGSCAFNLCLLPLMEMLSKSSKPLLTRVSNTHMLAASLSIVLLALTGAGIFISGSIMILPFIGLNSVLFALIYFLSLRMIYRQQSVHSVPVRKNQQTSVLTVRQILIRYFLFALITVAAALMLPYFAETIAVETGLSSTFVGTIFLAISTSLPEVIVSIAAVRMNSVDLAVGNILGSNIFNIFILFLDDVFYSKGSLLADASDTNLITVFATIIMSAVIIVGITFRTQTKRYLLAWESVLIIILYLLNMFLLLHQ